VTDEHLDLPLTVICLHQRVLDSHPEKAAAFIDAYRDAVTRIANSPPFIKGVINLRGVIVPIVDLRIKFSLGEPTYDPFTVVIILNIGKRVMGAVVDGVSDVIQLSSDDLHPVPEFGSILDTRYLLGLGTVEDRMIIMVDIEKLMASAEMSLVEAATA